MSPIHIFVSHPSQWMVAMHQLAQSGYAAARGGSHERMALVEVQLKDRERWKDLEDVEDVIVVYRKYADPAPLPADDPTEVTRKIALAMTEPASLKEIETFGDAERYVARLKEGTLT